MKTFKFSLVLHTRENTDVFITLDDNIYGIHSKRVNILYVFARRVVKVWEVLVYFDQSTSCRYSMELPWWGSSNEYISRYV